MIQRVARRTGIPALLLVPSLLLLSFASPLQGQISQQSQPFARNADWNLVGDEIIITYDLQAMEEGEYEVKVTFLNEANKSIRIPLKNVRGDIGTVRGPAARKTITWSYKNDIPGTISGSGFYFGFEMAYKGTGEQSGIKPGGIILLLGLVGVTLFLIFGARGDE